MRIPPLSSQIIAGFAVAQEFSAPVALLLGEHPYEHRDLYDFEEAAGDHVHLLAPNAEIEGTDLYAAALRLWRDAFPRWHPDRKTLGDVASLARQRWELVECHLRPISCAYVFERCAPRPASYRQWVQDERRQAFERVARAVEDCTEFDGMSRWVVPLVPNNELRDVFERVAGLDEATRHRLGIDGRDKGFLVRYAASIGAGLDVRLHPRQFEHLIAEVYESEGWRCTVLPYSKDGGIDVIASRHEDGEETILLIQAKRYRASGTVRKEHPVGLDDVKAFAATVRSCGRDRGVLVTTSRFTKGAELWAVGSGRLVANVDLVDGRELTRRLRAVTEGFELPGSAAHVFQILQKA